MKNMMKKTVLLMLGAVSLSGCVYQGSVQTPTYYDDHYQDSYQNPTLLDIQRQMSENQLRRELEIQDLQRQMRQKNQSRQRLLSLQRQIDESQRRRERERSAMQQRLRKAQQDSERLRATNNNSATPRNRCA
ncbi:MAG: hypothetical protein ACRCYZ_01150 [Alphaproteobacteria bacterium]